MRYSVITINRNNADGLRSTIESVVRQSCRDLEYIVIDGASTDGSRDVIREHAARIDYWVSEPDRGVYNAMNKGLGQAHGEFVIFMNSGDCFHDADVLARLEAELDDTDILFGNVCDAATGRRYGGIPAGSEVTFLTIKKEILCHQGTVYRRTIFDRHPYDESLRLIADWKVNVQAIVLDGCRVKVVDTVIADYDLTGMSSTQGRLHAEERQRVMHELIPERILRDYERLYTDSELPIMTLLPEMKCSGRRQRIVYHLARLILRLFNPHSQS